MRNRELHVTYPSDLQGYIAHLDAYTVIVKNQFWKDSDKSTARELADNLNGLPIKNLMLEGGVNGLSPSQIFIFFERLRLNKTLETLSCPFLFYFEKYKSEAEYPLLVKNLADGLVKLMHSTAPLRELDFSGNYLDATMLRAICYSGKIKTFTWSYGTPVENELMNILANELSSLQIIKLTHHSCFTADNAIKLLISSANLQEIHFPQLDVKFSEWLEANGDSVNKSIINITCDGSYDNFDPVTFDSLHSLNTNLYPILLKNNERRNRQEILIKNLIVIVKSMYKNQQQDEIKAFTNLTALPTEMISEIVKFIDVKEVGVTEKKIKDWMDYILKNTTRDTNELVSTILNKGIQTNVTHQFYLELGEISKKLKEDFYKWDSIGQLTQRLIAAALTIPPNAICHLTLLNSAIDILIKYVNRFYHHLNLHKEAILAQGPIGFFDFFRKKQLANIESIIKKWESTWSDPADKYIRLIKRGNFDNQFFSEMMLNKLIESANYLDKTNLLVRDYCQEIEIVKKDVRNEYARSNSLSSIASNLSFIGPPNTMLSFSSSKPSKK